LTRKTNHISIVQFDEHLISRLRVRKSSKGVDVIGFDQERGEWSAEDGTLEAALKEFAEKHLLAEDLVYTVLPRHDMTARILTLPSQDPEELEGMVRLSAEEYVPFPAEELVVDQCVLRKTPDGQSKVLAVFTHRDVVDTHIALLKSAKLDPVQVYLSTACLASAAISAKREGPRRYALVNLASGGLEAIVLEGGCLEYGRAIASVQDWGLADEAATEVMEELSVEVRASLSAYRRESEDGEGVEAVYLCSDWADVAHHCGTLEHEVGFECSPAPFMKALVLHGAEHLTALPLAALGAALAAQDRAAVTIRLLPESVIEQREHAKSKANAIRFGGLAAAILCAVVGVYVQAVHQRRSYIRELEARIAEVEPRAEGIISKQRQLGILQKQVDRSGSVIELLAALCNLYPESEINITRLQFAHGEGMDVWGRAMKLQDVETLARTLIETGKSTIPQFARAQQVYELRVRERNLDVLHYNITLPFPEAEESESEGADLE